MIEQYHEVYVRDLDDGRQEVVSFRWRVDLPRLARRWEDDWHGRMTARAVACRGWCVDNLGAGNERATWRVDEDHALFTNREDAMWFGLVWS